MKVLQVCAVEFTFNKFLLPLCTSLHDAGYEVHISFSKPSKLSPPRSPFFFHHIPIRRTSSPISILKSVLAYRKLLLLHEFDVVHVHTPVASLACRLATIGLPVKVLYTAHGFYFHDRMNPLSYYIHFSLERILSLFTDILFTQSREDAVTAVKASFLDSSSIHCIGNGVDPKIYKLPTKNDSFEARRALSIPSHFIVIGIVARVVREKGYLELLSAFRSLVDEGHPVHLLICGSYLSSDHAASAISSIESLQKQYPSSISFVGSRDDTVSIYHAMDIFCLPSWREGMPRTIIEAMFCGLPIVTSDIRGCREEVIHGYNGYVAGYRSVDDLTHRLRKLVVDSSLRQRMGSNSHQRAVSNYSEHIALSKQLTVYKSL